MIFFSGIGGQIKKLAFRRRLFAEKKNIYSYFPNMYLICTLFGVSPRV